MTEPTIAVRRDVLESWLRVSGYTNTQLARELNVSKGRISQILHSAQEEPSARLIAGLLRVTKLPFDRLFTFQERKILQARMRQIAKRRAEQQRKLRKSVPHAVPPVRTNQR